MPAYVRAVQDELVFRAAEYAGWRPDTVFIGGGTPSTLAPEHMAGLLRAANAAFPFLPGAEVTCECNPGTLTEAFLRALRLGGVNRLSIGAQASQDKLLSTLGRIHTWAQVEQSVRLARAAGFDNLNIDLMFGLPGQTLADFRETLVRTLALVPEHVSCYGLIVEEGTPLARDVSAGRLSTPEDEEERAMYELAIQMLAQEGLAQYEISNFARRSRECRHNIGTWTRKPYLGFGSAAHSFDGRARYANPAAIEAYLHGEKPERTEVSAVDARFESVMLGLRMKRGVQDAAFLAMHGEHIMDAFGDKLQKPMAQGLVVMENGALKLTRRGMDVQNQVLVELM